MTAKRALELAGTCSPDIALVDVELGEDPSGPRGEPSGLTLVRELRARHPALRVLVVSAHNKAGYVRSATEAGAHGYVLKEDGLAVLATAIRFAVHEGKAGGLERTGLLWDLLTDRQKEVACLLARGLTAGNIAAILGIKESTVTDHRYEVYRKLKLGSALEVAEYIRKNGIICPPLRSG
jgi:DNA-binding NarL/FixJ family response regulator